MLNAGSTALPYEPYTGGKPSPSPEYPQEIHSAGDEGEIDVGVTGAQLFPINLAASANGMTVTHNEDGTINVTGTPNRRYANILDVPVILPDGEYYLSSNGFDAVGQLMPVIRVVKTDGTIKYHVISGRVSIKNTSDIRMTIQYQHSELAELNISNFFTMLNVGSTALPFEPYQSQSLIFSTPNGLPGIPVDSGGNFVDATGQEWICNYRDWARGVDVKKVGNKTIDNTETWLQTATNDSSKYRYRLTSLTDFEDFDIAKASPIKTNGFCDILPITSADDNYLRRRDSVSLTSSSSSSSSYIYIYMQAFENATIEEFEEYIHQHPLNFILPLKNPIETPIPADELAAYQALQTYDGTTVFNMDSGEPAASWEVKALVVDPNNTNPQVMRLWLDEETGHPVNINGRGARVGDTPTQQYILQPCSF